MRGVLRFVKKHFKFSEDPVAPENPTHQDTDIGAECGRDSEDLSHGGGSRIPNKNSKSEEQQFPAQDASASTPGQKDDSATLQRRGQVHSGSAEAQNEQLGHNTSDLRPAKRDPDQTEHEGRGPIVQQPSEIASDRTIGDGQDGGDVHDIDQAQAGKSRAKERGQIRQAVDRFFAVVDLAKGPAEAFGPLKAVLESISVAYAIHQKTVAVKDKIKVFYTRIATLEELFEKHASDGEEIIRRKELLIKLKAVGKQVRTLDEKSTVLRYLDNAQDSEDVNGLLEDLQEAVNDYLMAQQMAIYDKACQLIDAAEMDVLNNFRFAHGVEHRHGKRKGCLKGTRGAVLNGIELWARDFKKSPPIYWLNGLAGTGKSTIAKTIAERLFAGGQLGASFFCSRDFKDRRNLTLIFPTLATQLARKYKEFRSILTPLIRSDPEVAYESLYDQMNKLIVRPLRETGISTVIVIDALDECEDDESASAILSILGQLVSKIPGVKFFLTGRPEPRISEGFRLPLLAKMTDIFILHGVEPYQIDSDIQLFFKNRFSELASRRKLDDWPTEEQLDRLCGRAAGLFVYAAATIKFIDNNKMDPRKQLNILLESQKIGACEGKPLDLLYMSILQEAFGDDDPERTRSVFAAVILAVNPLSSSAIATLLGFDADDVLPLLSSINSLLVLREDADLPVQPFHKSFPDFITDPDRCIDKRIHISPPYHHFQLLIGCLDLMDKTLEKNMCKLPDGVANSDVSDLKERTNQYINPALRYACMSWHVHLVDADTTPASAPEITSTLRQFIEKKFLFWLEVLSILGAVRNAVEALQVAAEWLEESQTLELVNDCSRFVTGYFEIISASSPHIYHSALVIAPQNSMVRKLYESHARPFTRVLYGAPMSWDQNTAETTRPFTIDFAVWSPCNRFIAITWDHPSATTLRHFTATIDVLDSVTLQRLQTLTSLWDAPTKGESLAFSPDSRILSSASHQNGELFVVSWDLQTGGVVGVVGLRAATPSAINVENRSLVSGWTCSGLGGVHAVSPITYSACGRMVGTCFSYMGSRIGIAVFDIASGVCVGSHPIEDRILLSNDIWAYGGSFRFATADAKTVTIWEVGFIPGATPTEVETLPVPDGFEPAVFYRTIGDYFGENFRFLPTLCRLALSSEDNVMVWDIRNVKRLLNHTGAKFKPMMSFSSDGRFFACSTTGSDVYLWKESPIGYALHEILVPGVSCPHPLLSRNGESIAVYGDRTIRLWRTKGVTATPSSIVTRAPQLLEKFVLDFSPDGMLAAIARQRDNTVTVLDLKSSVPQLTIDASMRVDDLGVIGNTVVVIGEWKAITWNLPAEDFVPDARVGLEESSRTINFPLNPWFIGDNMCSASISSDFHHIAFTTQFDGIFGPGTALETLHVCSISTGDYYGKVLTTGCIRRFSPDGCDIWCVDDEGEADVWRIEGRRVVECEQRVNIEHPPEGYPWGSSRGYRVTNDWWILGPDGKRLLMLPPAWQSKAVQRVWKGRFVALLHGGLSEPVILELDP